MKRFLKKISLLFLIGIIFSSCKKKETAPQCISYVDNYINPYLLNKFLFKAGSYWIYKDSLQNVNDSIYDYGGTVVHEQWSTYPMHGASTYNTYSFLEAYNNNSNISTQFFYRLRHNSIVAYGTSNTDYVSLVTSEGTSLDTNANVILLPSCNIGGINYSNVYRCFSVINIGSSAHSWGDPDSMYKFMKPGVGIVRSELYLQGQKRVYNLLNYHIQ